MKHSVLICGALLVGCAVPASVEPGPIQTIPAQAPTQEEAPVSANDRGTVVELAIPEPVEVAEPSTEQPLSVPVTAQNVGQGYRCPELVDVALTVGWAAEHLNRLDKVLWRESRCQPTAHNATDPNGGSHGVSQVNGFWCRPNRYSPTGWLQAQGVLERCADLYKPATNLMAALAIFQYSLDRNGCGWSPWATKGSKWC